MTTFWYHKLTFLMQNSSTGVPYRGLITSVIMVLLVKYFVV